MEAAPLDDVFQPPNPRERDLSGEKRRREEVTEASLLGSLPGPPPPIVGGNPIAASALLDSAPERPQQPIRNPFTLSYRFGKLELPSFVKSLLERVTLLWVRAVSCM